MKQQLAAGKDRRNDDTLKPPRAQPSPFPGGMPGDEDPILSDGNPPLVYGAHPTNFQNWMHDQAGAGGQVLGDIGIKDQMMQDIDAEIQLKNLNLGDQNVDMEDDNQLDMDMEDNRVPQHPDQLQDCIDFDQTYSTANYLRANGPDNLLSVEEVLAGIENNLNNADPASADDSGVVTSDRVATVTVPAYIIRACNKLPVDCVLPVSKVSEWKEDTQKAIVPVQPVVKVREPASKRRKVQMRIELDNPPSNAGEAANPIPLENL